MQFALRDFIQEISDDYDVILFDTPGGMDTLPAWSALLASHFVFSPVLPEKNSCESIFTIKRLVNEAIQNGNPTLIDLGYFICNRNSRVGLHKKREDIPTITRLDSSVNNFLSPVRYFLSVDLFSSNE